MFVLILLWAGSATALLGRAGDKVTRSFVERVHDDADLAYRMYGFPNDELSSLSCQGRNDWGGLAAQVIDSLDTLLFFNRRREFHARVLWLVHHFDSFDIDASISVFEANIRILGGLLAAHGAYEQELVPRVPPSTWGVDAVPYGGELLTLADELYSRLVVAFATPTGLPYGTINLRRGVMENETPEVCLACCGTYALEFHTLWCMGGGRDGGVRAKEGVRGGAVGGTALPHEGVSRGGGRGSRGGTEVGRGGGGRVGQEVSCTMDGAGAGVRTYSALRTTSPSGQDAPAVAAAAMATLQQVSRSNATGLVGLHVSNKHGRTTVPTGGLGAQGDSVWETLQKAASVYGGVETARAWRSWARTADELLTLGGWAVEAELQSGEVVGTVIHNALAAFYGAVRVYGGDVAAAKEASAQHAGVTRVLGGMPEGLLLMSGQAAVRQGVWPLRPEVMESHAAVAAAATDAQAAEWAVESLAAMVLRGRAPCGFGTVADVRLVPITAGISGPMQDRQETFFLGEVIKYSLAAVGERGVYSEDAFDTPEGGFVYTTEAHLLPIDVKCKAPMEANVGKVTGSECTGAAGDADGQMMRCGMGNRWGGRGGSDDEDGRTGRSDAVGSDHRVGGGVGTHGDGGAGVAGGAGAGGAGGAGGVGGVGSGIGDVAIDGVGVGNARRLRRLLTFAEAQHVANTFSEGAGGCTEGRSGGCGNPQGEGVPSSCTTGSSVHVSDLPPHEYVPRLQPPLYIAPCILDTLEGFLTADGVYMNDK